MRIGDTAAATSPQVAAERRFGTRLAALTGGRYPVQVVPAAALGDHHRMIEQVRTGSLTMTRTLCGNLARFDQRLGVLALPYLYQDPADLFAALGGALGAGIARIIEAADLVVLGYFDSGTRNVFTNGRPVHSPDDLRGLRLRVPQDVILTDTFTALGAKVVPLATTEIGPALRRGTIDGAENDLASYLDHGYAPLAATWSWTRHRVVVDVLLAGRRWFTDLPGRDRDAVVQAAQEAAGYQRQLLAARTAELTAGLAAGNVLVNDVDAAAFQRAVRPVIDKHRGEFGDLIRLLPVA